MIAPSLEQLHHDRELVVGRELTRAALVAAGDELQHALAVSLDQRPAGASYSRFGLAPAPRPHAHLRTVAPTSFVIRSRLL